MEPGSLTGVVLAVAGISVLAGLGLTQIRNLRASGSSATQESLCGERTVISHEPAGFCASHWLRART